MHCDLHMDRCREASVPFDSRRLARLVRTVGLYWMERKIGNKHITAVARCLLESRRRETKAPDVFVASAGKPLLAVHL